MLKKVLFILVLMTSLISPVLALECDFFSRDCDMISSPFVTFNLAFNDQNLLDRFEAEIYKKDNPSNHIRIETNQVAKSVSNLNPIIEPGVYVLKVRSFSKGETFQEKEKEFIFDNSQPLPPDIPLNLQTTSSNIAFSGKAHYPQLTTIAQNSLGGQLASVQSTEDSSFSLSLSGLQPGINYVKFFSQNQLNVQSEIVERIIVSGEEIISKNTTVSNIQVKGDLQVINKKTLKNVDGSYVTSKRNFYIEGTATGQRGSQIYVNGVPAVFDGNKFAAFLLLNQGDNLVKIQSGDNVQSFNIFYEDFRFQFLTFENKKFMTSPSQTFSGTVNFNLPFSLYLNGKFLREVTPNQGNFQFDLTGSNDLIKNGKNYIYLEGRNNAKIFDIFYYDTKAPEIEVLSNEQILNSSKFVFKVQDDIGIDFQKTKVIFDGGTVYEGEILEVKANLIALDVSQLSQTSHNYQINIYDFTGKSKTISGSLDLSPQNTFINSFKIENGYEFGNLLFLTAKEQEIRIYPSREIVFDKIYLDGVEQIDYTIFESGEVSLRIDLTDRTTGTIDFSYANSEKVPIFKQTFTYITNLEVPKLYLDYVYMADSSFGNTILVSGEINDSHFDWSSLNFDYTRIGNYFESRIEAGSSGDLKILGKDYSGNSFDGLTTSFGGLLYYDTKVPVLEFGESNLNFQSYKASLSNAVDRTKKFINSYDGFNLKSSIVDPNSFTLPASQRYGVRSVNLHGAESSQLRFEGFNSYRLDPLKPKIYFTTDDDDKYTVLIDGTLSPVETVKIVLDGQEIQATPCGYRISVYDSCFTITNELTQISQLSVEVFDLATNHITKQLSISNLDNFQSLVVFNSTKIPQVFLNGNDFITQSNSVFLQGQIISEIPIKSVTINGKSCEFDDYNFVCFETIDITTQEFNIAVTNLEGYTKDTTVPVNPNDDDLDGDGIPNNEDDDIDGDGLPNWEDDDDDNDGIPDDGDTDDDNDGVPDPDDKDVDDDLDNDGVDNEDDPDDDGDGIPDDQDPDDDNDGIPDDEDPDDDNDGVPDDEDDGDNPVIIYEPGDLEIEIVNVFGDNVYQISGKYLVLSNVVKLDVSMTKNSVVDVLFGGEEYSLGVKEKNFTVPIDLSFQINGKEEDEFDLWLRASNPQGEVAISQKIRIFYDRVLETLISIVIN